MAYWFKGESLESCLRMTRKQLLAMYIESFRVEAREQLRLVFALKMGHPQVKAEDYIDYLKYQANPPNVEDDDIGVEGVKEAMRLFGHDIRGDTDAGQFRPR